MKKILWAFGVIVLGALFSQTASAASKCESFESSMCIQVYAPAWCVALSVGGETLKKPVFSKGSNACVASNSLRKKLCDKGLNWKDLVEDEVHCVPLK